MQTAYGKGEGVRLLYFAVHLLTRCCFWNKNTEAGESGESIPIPAVVRTMTTTKIVHLYQEGCKNEGKVPLKERTCFRIMDVCIASKQKSLQGLDNTSTAGVEAFQTLETLVDNLARNGAGVAWGREIEGGLTAGRQYLKGEYKSHLGPNEDCADHGTVFALSHPGKEEFASVCDHRHMRLQISKPGKLIFLGHSIKTKRGKSP